MTIEELYGKICLKIEDTEARIKKEIIEEVDEKIKASEERVTKAMDEKIVKATSEISNEINYVIDYMGKNFQKISI